MLRKPVDTIAAIATPPGVGGIGIIRLSGHSLSEFAQRLTGKLPVSHKARLCVFRAADGSPIDRGILLFFAAPHSYTGEDVLELQVHGSPVVLDMLLQRCIELGARLAHAGEFTRRAFLNEKLDLMQAEAVADLIHAHSEAAARSALRSLEGTFSREIDVFRRDLTEIRLLLEGSLDFAEEGLDPLDLKSVSDKLAELAENCRQLIERGRQGKLLQDGIRIVLLGRPNVGKSSLLNRLLDEQRALVSTIPGTTRDILKETVQIEGIPCQFVDTAGLRATEDEIELLGIERAWQAAKQADLILYILDAGAGVTEEDTRLLGLLSPAQSLLIVLNKSDLFSTTPGISEPPSLPAFLKISARTGLGIDRLKQRILEQMGAGSQPENAFMARERHIQALSKIQRHLVAARADLEQMDIAGEALRLAQSELTVITGEFTSDDLLGEIFSRFCIGK